MKKTAGFAAWRFFFVHKKPQRGSWGFNGIAQTGEGCATPLFTFPARQGVRAYAILNALKLPIYAVLFQAQTVGLSDV